MKKIFIVGMARSGTTLVQQLLATHSSLVGINESAILKKIPDEILVSEGITKVARSEEEENHVREYLAKYDLLEKTVSRLAFLDLYCSTFVTDGFDGYTEKSPVHSFFISNILKEIPGSQIVLVLRDPRAIITSRLNTQRISRGMRFGLPKSIQFILNTTGTLFGYREFNKYFQKDRIHVIQYETLVTDPESVLRALFVKLGLVYEPVHEYINPTDMRMAYKKRTHTMNSSFQNEEVRTVQAKGISRWKEHITESQDKLIRSLFTKKRYPVLYLSKPYFEPERGNPIVKSLMYLLSYLDRIVFFIKNFR